MPMGLLFWILMLLWLVLGLYQNRGVFSGGDFWPFGGNLMLFVLMALLGWHTFGSPIR